MPPQRERVMDSLHSDRLQRLTPHDLRTYYPPALTMALSCLLTACKPDPTVAPLWMAMRAYLVSVREKARQPETDPAEDFAMALMVLRRMQLDETIPLFVFDLRDAPKVEDLDEQQLHIEVSYRGDLRALTIALWLTLNAIDQGHEQYAVDRSGYEGERLNLLNEALTLLPRISVNLEDAVRLH